MATALPQRCLGGHAGLQHLRTSRSTANSRSGPTRQLRPAAQLSSKQPRVRDADNKPNRLVLWRSAHNQHAGRPDGSGSPQRGALVVARSTLFDRVSRLSRAYVNFYSDSMLSTLEDPDIVLEQVLTDMRSHLQKLHRTSSEVLAAKLVMQKRVDAAVDDLNKWTKRSEAAVSAGMEDAVASAAIRRQRACQETVTKLRAQLAQHEAAASTLQGAIATVHSKMEEAAMRAPALKARAMARWAAAKATRSLRGVDGAFGEVISGAQAAFERAEAKVVAAELEGNPFGADADVTADDALEQQFAALEDDELEKMKQRHSRIIYD